MAHGSEVTAIPYMTSNTAPSGVVSANGYNTTWGNFPYYAFNKNINNYWQSNTYGKGWVGYKFVQEIIILKYALTSENGSNAPNSFELLASNDGNKWDKLDIQSNVIWNGNVYNQRKEFSIPNNRTPYLYYRINVLSVYGGSNAALQIKYIEMMELVYDYKCFLFDGSNYISKTNDTLTLFDFDSANESDFLNNGIDMGNVINLSEPLKKQVFIKTKSENLGTGKVFKQKIDTSKIPIKSVSIN